MEPTVPMREYVDKADQATLATAEKQIGELNAKIDALPTRLLWHTAGGVVATVGLVIGIVAFGGDRFDSGMSAAEVVSGAQAHNEKLFAEIEKRQADIDAKQDAKLVSMDEKLDVLIARSQ